MPHSRLHSKRRRTSRSTLGPLQTAIWGLSVGSALLAAIAVMHDDAPVSRLVAERVTEANQHRMMTSPGATPRIAQPLVAAVPRVEPNPSSATAVAASRGNSSTHFFNAAHISPNAEHDPAVQLDLPIASHDPMHAAVTQAPLNESSTDGAPLLTRTYRPVAMSAVSLERLVRPLLTARGQLVASAASSIANKPVAPAPQSLPTGDGEAMQPGVLVVSDRPEAIGRIDALCHDLEAMSPRIAIDLVVVNVVPTTGEQLPWEQWRNSFGTVESDLPAVLKQICGSGRTTIRARSQLQGLRGSWTELAWSEQNVASLPRADATTPDEEDGGVAKTPLVNPTEPSALTTLHVRPSIQPDGVIRLEVRAQSGRIENRGQPGRPQLVSVRFNTEVVLHEGATGVVNLFVDEPANAPAASDSKSPTTATVVIPGGSLLPVAKIVPQPGQREQTLLLLMPRIVRPARPGKIAVSQPPNPA